MLVRLRGQTCKRETNIHDIKETFMEVRLLELQTNIYIITIIEKYILNASCLSLKKIIKGLGPWKPSISYKLPVWENLIRITLKDFLMICALGK